MHRPPPPVQFIIETLQSAGHHAYAVGGCVRDLIMGTKPHDWDIATAATPDQTLAAFKYHKTIPTSIKHGTITLILDCVPYEITTFRTESGYQDHRRPDQVAFVQDIHLDLARRDLTINAIAISGEGAIIDPFDGQQDIEHKIIRCVGDPCLRFREDALRILRALRFAATLGFSIERETADAIDALAPDLAFVAKERILSELKRLILGANAPSVLDRHRSVLPVIFPNCSFIDYPRILHALHFAPPDLGVRFAMLMLGLSLRARDFESLRPDHKLLRRAKLLRHHFMDPLPHTAPEILNQFRELGPDIALSLVDLHKSISRADDNQIHVRICNDIQKKQTALLQSNACYQISQLEISGQDLIDQGQQGKQIGETLEALLVAVIDGKIENTKPHLLNYLRSL